jgi:hypothetical protein
MNRIGEILSLQHGQLDRLLGLTAAAAMAGEWAGYRARLKALREALVEHMLYEEEELFPSLQRGGLDAAEVAQLLHQHARLRMLLDTLSAAAPQHDPEGCLAELETLSEFQREHHLREQAACYPQSNLMAAPPPAPPPFADEAAERGPAPLDLRGLQPPEPIVRIFEALERAPGTPLRAILPHEPVPLYGLLRERGFAYTGTPRSDGGFEVLIERA